MIQDAYDSLAIQHEISKKLKELSTQIAEMNRKKDNPDYNAVLPRMFPVLIYTQQSILNRRSLTAASAHQSETTREIISQIERVVQTRIDDAVAKERKQIPLQLLQKVPSDLSVQEYLHAYGVEAGNVPIEIYTEDASQVDAQVILNTIETALAQEDTVGLTITVTTLERELTSYTSKEIDKLVRFEDKERYVAGGSAVISFVVTRHAQWALVSETTYEAEIHFGYSPDSWYRPDLLDEKIYLDAKHSNWTRQDVELRQTLVRQEVVADALEDLGVYVPRVRIHTPRTPSRVFFWHTKFVVHTYQLIYVERGNGNANPQRKVFEPIRIVKGTRTKQHMLKVPFVVEAKSSGRIGGRKGVSSDGSMDVLMHQDRPVRNRIAKAKVLEISFGAVGSASPKPKIVVTSATETAPGALRLELAENKSNSTILSGIAEAYKITPEQKRMLQQIGFGRNVIALTKITIHKYV